MSNYKTLKEDKFKDTTNIVDTGTEGTKIATGTTAQRGSTAGQIRFNTTTGLAEYYDGTQFKSLDAPPTVSSISPTSLGESVLGSSQTIVITGSNFSSTVTAKIIGNDATEYSPVSTTRNSNTQVTITTPTNLTASNEPYDIVITNLSGLSATLADALSINDAPVFSTASGSLGTLLDSDRSSSNLTAISFSDEESTPTVSVTSGSIPTGLTLNSNGTWSGTADAEVSDQTYNFTVTATDGSESATRNYSITVNAPLQIEFLVVAGGGSGGADDGGGGGAGGYRTSTQSYTSGTVITITVGDGGASVSQSSGNGTHGNNGSDSSISGSGLTTITSTGGGGGAFRTDTNNSSGRVGADGGSGGGGSINAGGTSGGAGGSGNTPSVTPSQGNNGGNAYGGSPYGGGGGGGASQAGSNAPAGAGGNGGDGTANSITGSSVTYAGGGGGGVRGGTAGSGGAGGGGAGTNTSGANATAGTANTGGGGGGATFSAGNSGAGGKGVVILRLLASNYTNTTTGSPTVSDDGSYKVLKFTGSGSYTA